MPPLFGLAPGGVYRAAPVARDAVRSCRTLSTLPVRRRAESFLWHCPSEGEPPGRALPGTVVPWSPDFPRPRIKSGAVAVQPSGGGRYKRYACPLRVSEPAPLPLVFGASKNQA